MKTARAELLGTKGTSINGSRSRDHDLDIYLLTHNIASASRSVNTIDHEIHRE